VHILLLHEKGEKGTQLFSRPRSNASAVIATRHPAGFRRGLLAATPNAPRGSEWDDASHHHPSIFAQRCCIMRSQQQLRPLFLHWKSTMSNRNRTTRRTFLGNTTIGAAAATASGLVPYVPWTATAFAN